MGVEGIKNNVSVFTESGCRQGHMTNVTINKQNDRSHYIFCLQPGMELLKKIFKKFGVNPTIF